MMNSKLFVLLLICIIQFSEEKSTALLQKTTTAVSAVNDEYSTVTEPSVTPELEDKAETVSSTEEALKNSSGAELLVDLASDDILLDPSVILARVERSVRSSDSAGLPRPIGESLNVDRSEDGIPTFYFVRFARVPRSIDDSELKSEKNEKVRMADEPDETVKRYSRSARDDGAKEFHGEEKGLIVKPVFKYRQEELKNYPRYPVFPGK